ncbi:MAG TPA: hypothetical protein DIW15_01115 [Bavariicoccus seileri]|uniref:Uncharacterized protein n=1 Tax=Bavariicoccus seileri TaxID=549685 RepID=A0A3D4S473_9ENTE|nr:hypothetical protein [Bavariicoccus seileri]HCS93292.1 hypothetical protein [Bavariicoccus seileri]
MYVGDIKESDVVVVTDYTTSIKTFNLFKQYAFSDKAKHKMMILNLLFLFLFIAIVICFFIIWLSPRIQDDSASKWLISSAIITTLVTLYLIKCYRKGVPNRLNLVKNTSSLLMIFELAAVLKERSPKISFALIDMSLNQKTCLEMLNDYLKLNRMKKPKIVFLDSVGNEGMLQLFTNHKKVAWKEKYLHEISSTREMFGDYLITAGETTSNGVLIKNANTRKDSDLIEADLDDKCDKMVEFIKEIGNY